ncbi:MAG: hypothetical protein LE169_01125 [Endomicrobium sp.]|nr:hypothetical protein [Endomicrobium sp.]
MKKTICICICICICLMSGCDKSLSHGRPVNAVVEDKATHSLTSDTLNASAPEPSNTPTPTPELSKSVQPSDTTDTGSSVVKYGLWAFAFIALIVGCYDVFRYFKPERIEIPAPKIAGYVPSTFDQIDPKVYQFCYCRYNSDISYTWYFAKRKIKRYFWTDFIQMKKIDSKIPIYQLCNPLNHSYLFNFYVYKPAPSK